MLGQNFIVELGKIEGKVWSKSQNLKFGQNLIVELRSKVWSKSEVGSKFYYLLKFLKAKFGQNLETEIWSIS